MALSHGVARTLTADFSISNPNKAPSVFPESAKAEQGGVTVEIKVSPGSRRNELRGIQEGAIRVAVTQIAEKGKANQAVLETLAKALGLRRSQISLVSGHTASRKRIRLEGMTLDVLQQRLAAMGPESQE